jgi:hypothetical protein
MKKIHRPIALAILFVLTVGVTAAFAGGGLSDSTTGARFSGQWAWMKKDHSDGGHGGWHFWGTIYDTKCDDGDGPYSKVKVEGYSANSFYGNQCTSTYQNWEVYDYQALWTGHAEWSVCRDRSFPFSDNCSSVHEFDRL